MSVLLGYWIQGSTAETLLDLADSRWGRQSERLLRSNIEGRTSGSP